MGVDRLGWTVCLSACLRERAWWWMEVRVKRAPVESVPAETEWDIREGRPEGAASRFQGKATRRRLPVVARGCAARGEDQSTGDDFITTRHSSTTLKYQKSGGLTQVWQSVTSAARRGAWKFSAQCSLLTGLKRLARGFRGVGAR